MAEFQFKSGVKTLDIKDPDGNVVDTLKYSVIASNEQIKGWLGLYKSAQSLTIPEESEEMTIEDIELATDSIRQLISSIVGAEKWDALWELSGKSLGEIVPLAEYLMTEIKDEQQKKYKGYV